MVQSEYMELRCSLYTGWFEKNAIQNFTRDKGIINELNRLGRLEEYIRIKLKKKELKLIFDMHGEIGLEEHLKDIM